MNRAIAVLILLGFLVAPLRSETYDKQNAAKYELAMYAEEWGLDWHADQYRIGDPWTAELIRPRKDGVGPVVWREANYPNLTDAVTTVEHDFEKYPTGRYHSTSDPLN